MILTTFDNKWVERSVNFVFARGSSAKHQLAAKYSICTLTVIRLSFGFLVNITYKEIFKRVLCLKKIS